MNDGKLLPFEEADKITDQFPEGKSKIYLLSSAPDKVVREALFSYANVTEKRAAETFDEAKKYFYRLRDNYGLAIPNIDLVTKNGEDGAPVTYMVVDKITPALPERNLLDAKELPNDSKDKLDSFYSGLIRSVRDDYRSGDPFWVDFNSNQVMYGRRAGETEDRFYIIDVDAYISQPLEKNSDDDGSRRFMVESEMSKFDRHITLSEGKFSGETKLDKARAALEDLKTVLDKEA